MAKSKRDSEAAYRARKLEQMQRQQEHSERTRRRRTVAIIVGVIVTVAIAVVVPAALKSRDKSGADKSAAAAADRPIAEFGVSPEAAGCAPLGLDPPQENWTKHINGDWRYDAAPPAGGPHSGSTLPTGKDHFYERSDQPPPERAVHDLEHGLVVGWYDKELPDSEVTVLRQVAAAAGNKKLRFLAVAWDRDTFSDGKHFVLAAWGVSQRCTKVSGQAVADFVAAHADAAGLGERNFPV